MSSECAGRSARGRCAAAPRYRLTVGRTGEWFACGRHVAWLLRLVAEATSDDVTVRPIR